MSRPLYVLAPIIAIVAAMIGFAVVPFGPVGTDQIMNFQIAPNINIGILYVFAIGSLAVYGVILAGWASNNKYAFIGALRSSAQLISYEIPLGMSILGMVLIAGSLDLTQIVNWQDRRVWGVFVQPIGFLLFLVSAFAETNRLPFDLPESEQELVGGFHTEYSGMKFGMFFLGEYLHVITVSYLTVILFFGGWDLPFVLDQHQTGLLERGAQGPGSAGQGRPHDLLHHVGAVDPAAIPVRPAHGPGLEVADPPGPGESGGDGRDRATGVFIDMSRPDQAGARSRLPSSRVPGRRDSRFPKEFDWCEPTTRN